MDVQFILSPKTPALPGIIRIESMFNAKIPTDYRDFLIKNNGGFSHVYGVPFFTEDGYEDVYGVYSWATVGIDEKRNGCNFYCMEKSLRQSFFQDSDRQGLLPIADTTSGPPVVISIRPDDYGRIYICARHIMSFVEESFSELLSKLRYDKEENVDWLAEFNEFRLPDYTGE